MSKERLIAIDGNTAGLSSVFRTRRLNSDPKILAFERGGYTSYSV